MANRVQYSSAFWLYVASQIIFLAFFGGLLTLKMSVLLEQTLGLLMVLSRESSPVGEEFAEHLESIPKNATGKILKEVLREQYWAGYARRVHG